MLEYRIGWSWQLEHFEQIYGLAANLLVAELDVIMYVQVVKVKHTLHNATE
jgi:hypothetical protein